MKLHCAKCGKFMADVRDASIRNGMIVLCGKCYALLTYTLNSERERKLARAMVDLMPTGTVVTFHIPPIDAVEPKPPVDYAMNAEPWEQVA